MPGGPQGGTNNGPIPKPDTTTTPEKSTRVWVPPTGLHPGQWVTREEPGTPEQVDPETGTTGGGYSYETTPASAKPGTLPAGQTAADLQSAANSTAIAGAFTQPMSQLSGLESQYNTVMSQLNNGVTPQSADAAYLSGASQSTGNATLDQAMAKGFSEGAQGASALNSAIAATTAGDQQTPAESAALASIPGALKTAEQALPYSDLFTTLLTQRKNELLYGSSAPLTLPKSATAGWSTALQDVYSYIEGNGANGLNSGTSGFDTLPGVDAAASGNSSNPIPTSGGAGAGQA